MSRFVFEIAIDESTLGKACWVVEAKRCTTASTRQSGGVRGMDDSLSVGRGMGKGGGMKNSWGWPWPGETWLPNVA